MEHDERFQQYRPLLFAIAYRMLGRVMDAEDVVQEAFLRWQRVAPETVESPKAFLTTVVTRLCLDYLRSARVQREQYVGPWLPEPLLVAPTPDPVALSESLSTAFLLLLESLSPVERAVFLLREVFDYDYAEVAQVVEKSEANCRQIVRRARERLAAGRPRFDTSPAQQRELTAHFAHACATGDLAGLLSLLAEDIALYADGGGQARAAIKPVHGAERVARFLLGVLRKAPPGFHAQLATVNGQPGFVTYTGDQPLSVMSFDFADGRIRAIFHVLNPAKLRAVPPAGNREP